MIKILRKGCPPEKRVKFYEIICNYCDTVFRCDETDLKSPHGPLYNSINCPICNKELKLGANCVVLESFRII